MSKSMAKEKFDAGEFISSLFHYAHDFNYNHIVFEANRYKVLVNLTRRSATYGNADMFYVSADTKSFAPVMSVINGAIEVAELASKQQAVVETAAMLGGPREEGPSLDTVFADYLTHADLTKYAVINPNSRTISISSADFAALNKKENAEDTTVNPVNPVDSTVASKVSEKTKPVVSKVVTTPNGKVFFV